MAWSEWRCLCALTLAWRGLGGQGACADAALGQRLPHHLFILRCARLGAWLARLRLPRWLSLGLLLLR